MAILHVFEIFTVAFSRFFEVFTYALLDAFLKQITLCDICAVSGRPHLGAACFAKTASSSWLTIPPVQRSSPRTFPFYFTWRNAYNP